VARNQFSRVLGITNFVRISPIATVPALDVAALIDVTKRTTASFHQFRRTLRKQNRLVDVAGGRPVRSIVVLKSGLAFLSPYSVMTILRFWKDGQSTMKQEEAT